MFNIFTKVFDFIYKIKVVHSIPGRLRVYVPAIKNVPEEWQVEEADIAPIFSQITGVKSISFSYISGNALIQYDEAVTNEQNVLTDMKRIIKIVGKYRKELENISPDRLKDEINHMAKIIKEELNKIE